MALWIIQNAFAGDVWDNLKAVCPGPGLSIDPNGRVRYVQTMGSVGCNMVADLSRNVVAIGIRGERTSWPFEPAPGATLEAAGGVTIRNGNPAKGVDIVYDVTNCEGHGSWHYDNM